MASAAKTREIWSLHRQTFSQTIQDPALKSRNRASDWSLLTGLPRASMLLLGYSVEMYLKGGLAKAYRGCSEEMFERDVKHRFSHKLSSLTNEIAFELDHADKQNISLLTDMILVDARYPVFVSNGASYADIVNQQTGRIWSSTNFDAFIDLANRVNTHCRTIDMDSTNPVSCESVNVDDDGYLTFRIGGHLPPRITYRLSTVQRINCKTSPEDMKALFVSREYRRLRYYWDRAWIYEDGEDKTSRRTQRSS